MIKIQNIALILIGITTLLNSIGIIILAVSCKGLEKSLDAVRRKMLECCMKPKEYLDFAEHCLKNFCYVKDAFKKVRRELIRKDILPQEFEYVDEDESVEEFINEFLKS